MSFGGEERSSLTDLYTQMNWINKLSLFSWLNKLNQQAVLYLRVCVADPAIFLASNSVYLPLRAACLFNNKIYFWICIIASWMFLILQFPNYTKPPEQHTTSIMKWCKTPFFIQMFVINASTNNCKNYKNLKSYWSYYISLHLAWDTVT